MKTTSRLAALLAAAIALLISSCASCPCCAGPGAAAPVKETKKA